MQDLGRVLLRALLSIPLLALVSWASINGSISGVVTDSSGAALKDAKVVAIDTQTGVTTELATDEKGFYNFAALPIGSYNIEVSHAGFKTFKQTALAIDANSALRVDAVLQVGTISETVEVTSTAVHVETESTQMGEVITGKTMTAVPLNGRAYTDLLALQPGVSPYTSTDSGMTGVNDRPLDGDLNSGNQSVNGQREAANGFMVNGSNVEEGKTNGAAILPNLDSIEEFRIITNNFDAEYGNYSGGQVNVVTKSGKDAFHGSAFEFVRNTAFDATQYFTDGVPALRQHQFGGTFGGPIQHNKTFFFVDYQGWRRTKARPVNLQLPAAPNFMGDFDPTLPFSSNGNVDANGDSIANTVGGQYFADLIASRQGLPPGTFQDGEPYYFTKKTIDPTTINPNTGVGTAYGVDCTSTSQCVFPTGVIPQGAWSPVATAMLNLGLIPQPNKPNNFSTRLVSLANFAMTKAASALIRTRTLALFSSTTSVTTTC